MSFCCMTAAITLATDTLLVKIGSIPGEWRYWFRRFLDLSFIIYWTMPSEQSRAPFLFLLNDSILLACITTICANIRIRDC